MNMNSNDYINRYKINTRHCWRLEVDDNESRTLPKEAAVCSEELK